jgi:hypothetical protein
VDKAFLANNLKGKVALAVKLGLKVSLLQSTGNNAVKNLRLADVLVHDVAAITTANFGIVARRWQVN